MLAFVLALPALGAQEEKKPESAKEQYSALLKEFGGKQQEIIKEVQKAAGEDREALIDKYRALGKDYAAKFYKLAEDNPKDPAAPDALAWVLTNGNGSPLMGKAAGVLVENHPDYAALDRIVAGLGRTGDAAAADALKQIVGKTAKPNQKAAATLALAQSLAKQTDTLGVTAEADKVAAEAEKYFAQAKELNKDNAGAVKDIDREVKILKHLRVGKEAPEIKAEDLDGKEFKLSDYRGKVVLLDFWGDW